MDLLLVGLVLKADGDGSLGDGARRLLPAQASGQGVAVLVN